MGLDQATAAVIGSLGGPVLANMFAPEGQELSSFEGRGAVDPVAMLTRVNDLIGRVGAGVAERAATPISLPSSYVQNVPTFTGGGLPMPIGVSASDPALGNPSLLNLQGMGQFQDLFSDLGTRGAVPRSGDGDGEGYVDHDGFHQGPNPGRPAAPTTPTTPTGPTAPNAPDDPSRVVVPIQATDITRRRGLEINEPGSLVRATDILNDNGDDFDQAVGAVNLLLESLRR